ARRWPEHGLWPGYCPVASHPGAGPDRMVPRKALCEQAGIMATASLGALLDTAVLLANQPVPAGRKVTIVTNAGGAGVLAADACVGAGLGVARGGGRAQQRAGRERGGGPGGAR